MTPHSFSYTRNSRDFHYVTMLFVIYTVLFLMYLVIDVVWWILAFGVTATLPAIWEIISNRKSGLYLTNNKLKCWSGRHKLEISFTDIDYIRFDTRFDFSVRVSALTVDDKTIRLPYDALPNMKILESACKAHGLRTKRKHFLFAER
ncbi:MAG: hypothetical protein OXC62_02035 [Aestuariivita sp.]|nr:hypothetical protein [Aestuariivita sp.]